jgi:hypothetical protein
MEEKEKKKPNLKEYFTGAVYSISGVTLTKDLTLDFYERSKYNHPVLPLCMIYATRVINLEDLLRKESKRKDQKKKKFKPSTSEEIEVHQWMRYPQKWYKSFKKKELEKLIARYYVEGEDHFCLAITPVNLKKTPYYKFLLPEYLFSKYKKGRFSREQEYIGVDEYWGRIINEIRGEYGNECMKKREFLPFLDKIRKVVEIFERNKTIKQEECKKLNQIKKELPEEENITADLLHSFFDSLIKDLIKNKIIFRCEFCGDYFLFRRNKKFCSLKTEGKDCAKKARNKRYYETKAPKLREKSRKEMRETRAEYKKHGLKY